MGVSKNRGFPPKLDGLFHGKPYEQMDDLGDITTSPSTKSTTHTTSPNVPP